MADEPTNEPASPILGYANGTSSWWNQLIEETTPELRWPQSIATYERMRTADSQVKSILGAVKLPIRRTPWRIDPNGAELQVVEHVALDLGLPVVGATPDDLGPGRSRGRFSFGEHLEVALLCLDFGHAIFEQSYYLGADGLLHLRKLEYRPPETIAKFNVALDGGLESIVQNPLAGDVGQRRPIPVSRLVAYVMEREGTRWRGRSAIRAAYKNWITKDRLMRIQAETAERNGMGVPRYTGAPNEKNLDRGAELATAWRSGARAGAAIPEGAKLDLVGVSGTLPDIEGPLRYQDEGIARSLLGHFLNLGQEKGSYALSSTLSDFFALSLQAIADQMAEVLNAHVVEDLVDLNYGPDARAPRVVFQEIGSQQIANAGNISQLVNSKVIIPDPPFEAWTRDLIGAPAKNLPPLPPSATPPPDTAGA